MKLFCDGVLAAQKDASFKSKDGQVVAWYNNEIQAKDENGFTETLQVGSREDYGKFKGQDCTFAISVRPDASNPRLSRLSLIDVNSHLRST